MGKQDKVRLKNLIKEGEEHLALFTEALNGKSDNSGRERLRSFVSRIERMEEEKKAIQDDIKEIYAEANGVGFDAPILKIIIRRRKEDAELRKERELLVEIYESAIEGRQLDLFVKEKEENATEEVKHDPETGEIIEDVKPVEGGQIQEPDSTDDESDEDGENDTEIEDDEDD